VLVSGDPFPVPRDQFAADVADALRGTMLGANTTFVPAPQGSPAAYREWGERRQRRQTSKILGDCRQRELVLCGLLAPYADV
jgi:hypothetical protein